MVLWDEESLHLPLTPALTSGDFSFPLRNDQLLFIELFQTVLSILYTSPHLFHNTPRRKVLTTSKPFTPSKNAGRQVLFLFYKWGNQGTKKFNNLLKITWLVSSRRGSEPLFLATVLSQHHSNVAEQSRLKPLWPDWNKKWELCWWYKGVEERGHWQDALACEKPHNLALLLTDTWK